MKRCTIINYKHGIYKLAHELPNDVRLKTEELVSNISWIIVGLLMDSKLIFLKKTNEKTKEANKRINAFKKFNASLPRSSPITIFKSPARPHQAQVKKFTTNQIMPAHQIKPSQPNIMRHQLPQGLLEKHQKRNCILESLKDKRWLRRLCYLYKITSTKMTPYPYDILYVDTYALFHKNLLAFIKSIENILYSIYGPLGIKLLHRLQVGFCHLRDIS